MKKLVACLCLIAVGIMVQAQTTTVPAEKRVGLSETAVALDSLGASALEGMLKTSGLNGTPEAPVTHVRFVVRNTTSVAFGFVSGIVTFYDSSAVRCGEGVFKTEALAANESLETDSPGIRISCSPTSWRIVATSLVPRVPPTITNVLETRPLPNLVINIDGDSHPIQLDRPMTLKVGDKQRTIVIKESP